MRMRAGDFLRLSLVAALAATAAGPQVQQAQMDLLAKARVFPEFGPSLTALKRDAGGRYAILTSRGPLVIVDAQGKRLGQIPAAANTASADISLLYADDFDFDAEGRVLIADRGANAVRVFTPEGKLERSVSAPAPNSVVALAEGEVAVTSTAPGTPQERLPRTVNVYDARGRLARQFGTPLVIAERVEVNRLLNFGRLLPGPQGHMYFSFSFFPEPTVRRYDRFGFAVQEISVTSLEFAPVALAARREIAAQDKKRGQPSLKPVVTALGVDPDTEEVWMSVGHSLLHFDREGNPRGTYRTYTPEGARLEASVIVVEPKRLLIGNDPLGIYEFAHPTRTRPAAPAKKSE